jgi:pimeloyl-ACP methyl ester carboxylesterase
VPIARVNDIDVNYRLEGDGEETIVLVNGLADDLETWAYQVDDFLAAGYRVLRFDNRGSGRARSPPAPTRAGCSPMTRRHWSATSASTAST